jgi:hypothetical protein
MADTIATTGEIRSLSVRSPAHTVSLPAIANPTLDLDQAILAYLVQRGFPRSAKAFEKEAGTKAGTLGDLQKAWETFADGLKGKSGDEAESDSSSESEDESDSESESDEAENQKGSSCPVICNLAHESSSITLAVDSDGGRAS